MAAFLSKDSFSKMSLEELKPREESQKSGTMIFSCLAGFMTPITFYLWYRQDFSLNLLSKFNPVFYCLLGLVVFGLIVLGINDVWRTIRKEIASRK
ncbi:MAG: hypothetical protein U5M51_05155 [Emticicia sp.]|nr:hypothetical protein [Emticicia sp.]